MSDQLIIFVIDKICKNWTYQEMSMKVVLSLSHWYSLYVVDHSIMHQCIIFFLYPRYTSYLILSCDCTISKQSKSSSFQQEWSFRESLFSTLEVFDQMETENSSYTREILNELQAYRQCEKCVVLITKCDLYINSMHFTKLD